MLFRTLGHMAARPAIAWATSTLMIATVLATSVTAQHSDVLLQVASGKIATGLADYENNVWTLGTQVYRRQFLSNFRSSDPGFASLAYGNANMPLGAEGFPSNHNVSFDLLPMMIEQVKSNLFYWNGSDSGGNGLDLSDVQFVPPTGVKWEVFDANFNPFAATGTDQFVPGGLIQKTSADIDPNDGVDSGAIHKHLVLQLSDNDGNPATSPAAGVYMIAWQARSVGFETSDPFVFVHRTSTILDTVRDLAADWAAENIDMLFTPPILAGDYNQNEIVDAADYTVWRDNLGGTIPHNETASMGIADVADYDAWRAHFGATFLTGAATIIGDIHPMSVPEPSSLLFAMLACLTGSRWINLSQTGVGIPGQSVRPRLRGRFAPD
ncbi:MAG: hypothetical protein L0Z07_02590 [Planctomycetes bacterium]|nr:hypothetical protein [Planctomycetota bacterium]